VYGYIERERERARAHVEASTSPDKRMYERRETREERREKREFYNIWEDMHT
jgi:hypothetical protein